MENLSWNYFQKTGCIDAYLLYRDYQSLTTEKENDLEIILEEGEEL